MSNLLKRKLFIQAVSCGTVPRIQISETEYESTSFISYVTLGTTEVEFEDPCLTDEQFAILKAEQLDQLKSKIMLTAQQQCDALGK